MPGQPQGSLAVALNRRRFWRRGCEQRTAQRELCDAMGVGQKADVADAVKPVRHSVLQERADEFVSLQPHYFGFAVMPVVLPSEADFAILVGGESAVGDGDPVRVAAKIAEHLFGACERTLGEDDPFDAAQLREARSKSRSIRKGCERAGETQFASRERGAEPGQKHFPEP